MDYSKLKDHYPPPYEPFIKPARKPPSEPIAETYDWRRNRAVNVVLGMWAGVSAPFRRATRYIYSGRP